ncbi:MAG: hypothetical protein MK102_01205 [Fuerstiella sp.]|nr:hypothetical protein [Fuerstiella sp.]
MAVVAGSDGMAILQADYRLRGHLFETRQMAVISVWVSRNRRIQQLWISIVVPE